MKNQWNKSKKTAEKEELEPKLKSLLVAVLFFVIFFLAKDVAHNRRLDIQVLESLLANLGNLNQGLDDLDIDLHSLGATIADYNWEEAHRLLTEINGDLRYSRMVQGNTLADHIIELEVALEFIQNPQLLTTIQALIADLRANNSDNLTWLYDLEQIGLGEDADLSVGDLEDIEEFLLGKNNITGDYRLVAENRFIVTQLIDTYEGLTSELNAQLWNLQFAANAADLAAVLSALAGLVSAIVFVRRILTLILRWASKQEVDGNMNLTGFVSKEVNVGRITEPKDRSRLEDKPKDDLLDLADESEAESDSSES